MAHSTPEQLRFPPIDGLSIRADFKGGALSSDFGALLLRSIDQHAFMANHLRLYFSCAAYVLYHSLRSETLSHTELSNAQPATIMLKLFKLAVRVVQYKDLVKLHLPSHCAVKSLLHKMTEILHLVHHPDNAPFWRHNSHKFGDVSHHFTIYLLF